MRKCRICKQPYEPRNSLQSVCSPACAVAYARWHEQKRTKELKAMTRRQRQDIKTHAELVREAQVAFNAWIRERDIDRPCISCGTAGRVQWHAGHYRTTKAAPELRFHPLNCHKQCAQCNNHKSGNLIEYRINLVGRIGQEAVEWLEGPHEPAKWSRDELVAMKKEFLRKARELKRKRESVPGTAT